jgi:hypothetical protein
MKSFILSTLTAAVLAKLSSECVNPTEADKKWTEVTVAAITTITAITQCKDACAKLVTADTDKAKTDYCCDATHTLKVAEVPEVKKDDNATPKVEGKAAVPEVPATLVCSMWSKTPSVAKATIAGEKKDTDLVKYASWDYVAGAEVSEEAAKTEEKKDADADAATKVIASVLASAALVATMY